MRTALAAPFLIMMSFATELATPSITDVRTYGHLTALPPQSPSPSLHFPDEPGLNSYLSLSITGTDFYHPDVLPVTQPKVSKQKASICLHGWGDIAGSLWAMEVPSGGTFEGLGMKSHQSWGMKSPRS